MNPHTARNHNDEHDDDLPVGRVLSRREILALLGTAGAALLGGGALLRTGLGGTTPVAAAAAVAPGTTTCVATPELTEGPYFVDEKLYRSDLRTDPTGTSAARAGVPLALTFAVTSITGTACAPLAGATVDIWHCDATGLYSDEQANGTVGQKWLRGAQTTGTDGLAPFTTIYPGWYQGRAVHIHFKIRTAGANGQAYEFTSQLFFDETLNDAVFAQSPYSDHRGTRLRNAQDGIYAQAGSQLLLAPAKTATGYAATFNVGLNLADTNVGRADGVGGNGDVPGGASLAGGQAPPGRGGSR